ncbi:MAG: YIP1 family protein [Candidatus Nanohaloarchaea archaeon]
MGWFSEWFRQGRSLLAGPARFFDRFQGPVTTAYAAKFAATSLLVMAVLDVALGGFLLVAAPQLIPGIDVAALLTNAGMTVIGGIIGVFVSAAILHVSVYLLGGRDMERTLTVVAYATAIQAFLGWIPLVNLIGVLYVMYAQLRGIEKLHRFSLGRATAAFLLPVIVIAVILGGLALASQWFLASTMADIQAEQQQQMEQLLARQLTVQSVACDAARDQVELVISNDGAALDLSSVTVTVRQNDTVVETVPDRNWSQKSFAEGGGVGTVTVPAELSPGATYSVSLEYPVGDTSQTVSAGECVAR